MPSLRELQGAFGAALLHDDTARIEPFVFANGLPAQARLRIYRNNTRENFLAALRASFPVLERLTGEDYFRQLAFDYRERFPSTSGNLHHVGTRLPLYLERRFAGTEYGYFPDVARLECAYQDVLVAPDHEPLDTARLLAVPSGSYPRLIFTLAPAVRLVSSRFPVWTIWKENQPDADPHSRIDLGSGAEHVLLRRADESVELRRLEAPEYDFLCALAAGATLADAAARTAAFDVGGCLRRCVAAGAIVDFSVSRGNPS